MNKQKNIGLNLFHGSNVILWLFYQLLLFRPKSNHSANILID